MKRKIIRAEYSGFCMGVLRAVKMVNKALESREEREIATFGPIIHNRQVISNFKEKGVGIIHSPEEAKNKDIIIRAHGAPPNDIELMTRNGARIYNGTCPNVIASQKIVAKYSALGYMIILAGDKNHGEVVSLSAHAQNCRCHIVSGGEDARTVSLEEKNLLLCQTTIKQSEFDEISLILKQRDPDITIKNTICSATDKRQKSLLDLKDKVDAFIIIGGKNSANTKRLQMAALSTEKPSWHIETADDLPEEIFKYEVIGVSAGASTPENIIESVIQVLEET